jgi:hypothetical protein
LLAFDILDLYSESFFYLSVTLSVILVLKAGSFHFSLITSALLALYAGSKPDLANHDTHHELHDDFILRLPLRLEQT